MVRSYLVEKKRVKPQRFELIDGGFISRGMTDFYLIPEDANFPMPSFKLNDVLNK
jgi:hypothetical protein